MASLPLTRHRLSVYFHPKPYKVVEEIGWVILHSLFVRVV
jgi:hypothetical protein